MPDLKNTPSITGLPNGSNWKRDTVLFIASQTLSLFGTSLVQYAMMWYITLSTQSGVMMTVYIICGFLPTFLLSPFAGVWADRYNRKNLIMLSDTLIAAVTLILAILFLLGYKTVWLLFVMAALRAFGTAVQTPAVGAFLPQLVPQDKLTKVNGINGSIQSLVMLVSPMISGALLAIAAIETIFFIDVVTAAIAVTVLFVFLKVATHAKALQKQTVSYFGDLSEGIRYVLNHPFLKIFFLFAAVFFFLAAPSAFLTPLQVTRSFGDDVWRLTAIEVAFSLGMVIGGLGMASWGGLKNRVNTMTLAALMIGVCTLALGVVPVFWIYLLFMFLIGVAMPIFNVPAIVLLQEKVEGDFLGRVFGVLTMISSSMMPLGMLVFGPLADVIKIEWMLIVTGVLLFIQGFFLLGNKTRIEPERQEQPAGKP
ncbi:MFS transporter [Dehalobacter restrictus]|uniref:MFS transporter n=1 Tax=Dehalobacter restrictus TaxID=55583 RepID=A0A857DHY6_9FIRM|nr:MFS transporter [Dehalobacter restrictus]QHA00904.1 MFS transporter [Dehalobacter restrictus]